MFRLMGPVLLALLLRCASAQVAWPASGPELCAVPSTLPIRPDSTCADFGHGSSCDAVRLDVAAQRGETESVQLLLRRSSDMDSPGGLRNVTVNVFGLPPHVASVSVFQVGFVDARHSPRYQGSGGGWRPDPLLPPPAGGFDVSPDQAQALWIEVSVSAGARPGVYDATVAVSAAGGERERLEPVPLRLTVWNTSVPSLAESRLGTAWSGSWTSGAFADYYGKQYWNSTNRHKWYDVLLKARTPPDAIYQSPSTLRPVEDYIYLASKGVRWFAILDVTRLPLFPDEAEPAVRQQPLGSTGGRRLAGGACANYTDEYVQRLLATLKPIVTALDDAGIGDRAYIYGFDENPIECEPQVRKLFGATKAAFPKLTTAAVLNWSPMPTAQWSLVKHREEIAAKCWGTSWRQFRVGQHRAPSEGLPAAWGQNRQLGNKDQSQSKEFNATDAEKWAEAGKLQWHYHCIEPASLRYLNTFIERRAMQPRLLFWLAALMQAEHGAPNGWLYYEVNLWSPCKSSKCGGPHQPRVMRRKRFSGPSDPRAGFENLAFTDFPPANYIWQPQYNDIFANGDGQYLYPCEDGPCSTLRLSAIRDGLEDWELFAALGSSQAIPLLKRLVRSPTDWTEDAVLLESTRREAAALLDKQQQLRQEQQLSI